MARDAQIMVQIDITLPKHQNSVARHRKAAVRHAIRVA